MPSAAGTPVTVPDLREVVTRWPEYAATAARHGIRAAAGIPLKLEDTTIGALDLYAREVRDWPAEDVAAAQVLADMATSYLVNVSKLEQHRQLNEQLEQALQSRIVIEQAKGITANAGAVSVDSAFGLIRRHARSQNANAEKRGRSDSPRRLQV
jgi:GAF domain-containing protein